MLLGIEIQIEETANGLRLNARAAVLWQRDGRWRAADKTPAVMGKGDPVRDRPCVCVEGAR